MGTVEDNTATRRSKTGGHSWTGPRRLPSCVHSYRTSTVKKVVNLLQNNVQGSFRNVTSDSKF